MTRMMAVVLLAATMAFGCGGEGTETPDAGPMATDAGETTTDAGETTSDAGPVEVDAGPVAIDAGPTTPDAGGGGGGACTNAADMMALARADINAVITSCVQTSFGAEPATSNCIQMMTGLSDGCTMCFGGSVSCVTMNCLAQCLANPMAPACTTCRMTNCDPEFVACSGLSPM